MYWYGRICIQSIVVLQTETLLLILGGPTFSYPFELANVWLIDSNLSLLSTPAGFPLLPLYIFSLPSATMMETSLPAAHDLFLQSDYFDDPIRQLAPFKADTADFSDMDVSFDEVYAYITARKLKSMSTYVTNLFFLPFIHSLTRLLSILCTFSPSA